MKRLNEYLIYESKLSDSVFCEQFSKMFVGTKLPQDTIKIILNNIDKDFIQKLSNHFVETDNSNYLAYDPGEDTFINYNDNKDKIIAAKDQLILELTNIKLVPLSSSISG